MADSKSLQPEAFPSNNVAITTAMLKLLNEREQNAVMGHELGRRKDGDQDGITGSLQVIGQLFKATCRNIERGWPMSERSKRDCSRKTNYDTLINLY
ncbi:MAG: M48 family metalloprotease [Acidobacteriia bacterium]|nr:M48 family metalloprotease [Terriglobia bacterium]